MMYQISYLSPAGNCAKLAEAFEDILEDAGIVDLSCENETDGQIHLVGFEINESNFKAIPYEIMELLDGMEGKTVLLFATCPFQADEEVKNRLERTILPFLPDACDYRGLFLCSGQASDAFLSNIRTHAAQHPDDKKTEALLKSCQASVGHPDENDIMQACLFVSKELELY